MILRDRDANTGWDAASDGVLEERIYYCQNWRHDVVAIVTDTGAQAEQVRYSAYAVPFGLPAGDVNSSGDVTSADDTIIANWIDMDLDGDVDNTDRTALQARIGDSLGRENLSRDVSSFGGGNRKGYAGYEGDFSRDGFWHVRHRVLDSDLGRWTRRDPLGYVDGVSLYQYVLSQPLGYQDALGLSPCSDGCEETYCEKYFLVCEASYKDLSTTCVGVSWVILFFRLIDECNCSCSPFPDGETNCGVGCSCKSDGNGWFKRQLPREAKTCSATIDGPAGPCTVSATVILDQYWEVHPGECQRQGGGGGGDV